MVCHSKRAGCRAKWSENRDSGNLLTHIWGTFDLVVFIVIWGSFGALVSKCNSKTAVIEQKSVMWESGTKQVPQLFNVIRGLFCAHVPKDGWPKSATG